MSWEESFSKGWISRFSTPMVKKQQGLRFCMTKEYLIE